MIGAAGSLPHGAAAMILFEPIEKMPETHIATGFIPLQTEDDVAQLLLRPHFPDDDEMLLLAGFDGHQRLIRLEAARGDGAGRCRIPPHCWCNLLRHGVATVVMAHNHPSGDASPSDADIRCTREAARLLRLLDIELFDHLIFVDNGHFSFRQAQLM